MLRTVLHAVCPSDSRGGNVLSRQELAGRFDGAPVGYGERVVRDGVGDRTPDVHDADATLEEAFGVGGELVVDTTDAGFVGLVCVGAVLKTQKVMVRVHRQRTEK